MTLEIFQKCMKVLKTWREAGHKNYEWPDSRDPDFHNYLIEGDVVPQDLEKSFLALCAWRTSRGDVYRGMSSVIHVLRNRQNVGMARSHVQQDPQFDCMTLEGSPELDTYPELAPGQDFVELLNNLDDILSSKTVDFTQGSTVYGVVGEGGWFQYIVDSPDYERVTKIGSKTFYKPRKK